MSEPEVLLDGLAMGESPRWHDGRLWFSNWGVGEIVIVNLVRTLNEDRTLETSSPPITRGDRIDSHTEAITPITAGIPGARRSSLVLVPGSAWNTPLGGAPPARRAAAPPNPDPDLPRKEPKSSNASNDLPENLSRPAQRALAAAGVHSLEQLTRMSKSEILKLHGMGPKAMEQLRNALAAKGLSFADTSKNASG